VLSLAVQLACLPKIVERCRLVTDPIPPPALPAGFAEIDALLLRRATDMTVATRDLNRFLVFFFHKEFAEGLLPFFCGQLERARELAMAGRTAEAGRKYQSLLVMSQVLAFGVAVYAMAQYADIKDHPEGQVTRILQRFESEAAPIFDAAQTEDPREIVRALDAHPEVFARWAKLLGEWPVQIDDASHQVKVAMVVWDIAFLVVATYEAAGAAAELAAAGRPPMPPLPALATGGGMAAAGLDGAASLELAEVVRKLVASGALDAGVVAALSRTLGGRAASSPPNIPNVAQMSADPKGSDVVRGPIGSGPSAQAKTASGGSEGTITLYRAVGARELADIQAVGRYRVPAGGVEGKYLFRTPEQASNFARMMGDQPYATTSVRVSPAELGKAQPVNPAREGPGYFFKTSDVPSGPVTILDNSVVPP